MASITFVSGTVIPASWLNDINTTTYTTVPALTTRVTALEGGSGLLDGSVTAAKLASNAVTTVKILDGNVTFAKLGMTGTPSANNVLKGDGSWGSLPSATGGGGDSIFFENGQTVTTNYSITSGKNALSAGPITINTGITVTIPTGSVWSIV